ncbi:hypothetical protein [Thermogutta sp.]|uniref:hypothetical protein n=1 Tax=Thermogutta sp. TaxID=1962930 RepID=UPI0032203581
MNQEYVSALLGKKLRRGDGESIPGVITGVVSRNQAVVRTLDRGEVIAVNTRLPNRVGLPVYIQYQNGVWQVTGIDHIAMPDPGQFHYVPSHAEAHQFNHPYGGDDTLWLPKQQYTPFLVAPTQPPSLFVRIFPGMYYDDTGTLQGIYDARLLDLSPYYGGNSLLALIALDVTTGEYVVRTGAAQPAVQPTEVPLAFVRLRPGAVKIHWDDILDARDIPPSLYAATSGIVHSLIAIRRFTSDGRVITYRADTDGLASALAESSSGDRIIVPTGTYSGSFTIPTGVFVDFQWSVIGSLTVMGVAANYTG